MADVDFQIESAPCEARLVSAVTALATEVFGSIDESDFRWRLEKLPVATLTIASRADNLVGFKLGYALSKKRYQSWLGGVHAEARRQGIARHLMKLQHDWAAANGFSSIETTTTHDNAAMLALNRESGFRLIGEYNRDGVARIMHHKDL